MEHFSKHKKILKSNLYHAIVIANKHDYVKKMFTPEHDTSHTTNKLEGPKSAKHQDHDHHEHELVANEASGGIGVLPITLMGIGALGLGAGFTFGASAQSHHSLATDPAAKGRQTAIEQGGTAQTRANIGFAVGGLSLAAGVILWLLDDDGPEPKVAFLPLVLDAKPGATVVVRGW